MGPIRGDQRQAILDGIRACATRGVHLGLAITNEPGLPGLVKSIDPDCKVLYRRVYTGHDPLPWADPYNLPHGRDWFQQWWDREYSQIGSAADWFSFHNEGWDNRIPVDCLHRRGEFVKQLIDASIAHRTMCSGLVCNAGTPGLPGAADDIPALDALRDVLSYMEATGCPLDYHAYDLLDMQGRLMPRAVSVLRFQYLTAQHPRLTVIGGEMGNAGKADDPNHPGLFGPWSAAYMQQFVNLLRFDPNWLFGAWWCLCDPAIQRNPEGDWSGDDWTAILPWFYDWVTAT